MTALIFLFDVSPEPVARGSGVFLILLLGIILFLAVAFASGLVFLLIWLKRRKMKGIETGRETITT